MRHGPSSIKILVWTVLAFAAVGLGLFLVSRLVDSSEVSFQKKGNPTQQGNPPVRK
jgi:hypothetical protein